MRSTSCDVLPIRDHAFFEQAVLEGDLGQRLLELTGFGAERLDLVGRRLANGVAGQPLLAGLEELLGPSVVEVLGDPFLAAQLGDAVLAAQAFQDDADLLLGREVPPGGSPDVPDGLLRALRSLFVSLSHRVPPRGYDEPQTLPYAISSICPVGPDGGQCDGPSVPGTNGLCTNRRSVSGLLVQDGFLHKNSQRAPRPSAGRAPVRAAHRPGPEWHGMQ
jgi:hypothetical protein